MNGNYFVDTNLLVYSRDLAEPDKQPRAAAWMEWLWKTHRGRISVQVLQEFYQTVTLKLKPGMDPPAAHAEVDDLFAWRPCPVDHQTFELAWSLEDRYTISWWDALIVAAAHQERCRFLLTEDLQDGQEIDQVRIVDPFTVKAPLD